MPMYTGLAGITTANVLADFSVTKVCVNIVRYFATNPIVLSKGSRKLVRLLMTRDLRMSGCSAADAAEALTMVQHACASGAGNVGSDRNFFVEMPTKPYPMKEPAAQNSIITTALPKVK